ncbi:GNAT family acetyltransferase YjcF [Methanosarcina sp. MTP4]|nr:GNAT family acetyltransferase YjcF [Methanosarcina sp. MTP4]
MKLNNMEFSHMDLKQEHSFEIKWIRGNLDLEDPYYVRQEVFMKEQNVPEEEEMDAADAVSWHVVVYENSKPVATGRIFKDCEVWLIGRIAVLKEYRGKQVGKLVVEKLLERAVELQAGEVHVHAQTYAAGFYEKLGFVAYGETFMESDIEHIGMIKKM